MGKETIIDKALELFSAKGYDGTSMEDIARAAGIKKASIYAHFPGKEHVFSAVLQRVVDEYEAWIQQATIMNEADDAPTKLRELFVGYVAYCYGNAKMEFWDRSYYYPPAFAEESLHLLTRTVEQRLIGRIADIIDRGIRDGSIVAGKAFDMAQSFYFMMVGLAMSTKFYGADEIEAVAAACADVFLAGIRSVDRGRRTSPTADHNHERGEKE